MRHHDIKKHGHDSGHALEMDGPRLSAEPLGYLFHTDDCLMINRIHLARFGNEKTSTPTPSAISLSLSKSLGYF